MDIASFEMGSPVGIHTYLYIDRYLYKYMMYDDVEGPVSTHGTGDMQAGGCFHDIESHGMGL